ncbi:MAG: hypothetical protein AAFX09_08295 [Pseudomonadota bacterium]
MTLVNVISRAVALGIAACAMIALAGRASAAWVEERELAATDSAVTFVCVWTEAPKLVSLSAAPEQACLSAAQDFAELTGRATRTGRGAGGEDHAGDIQVEIRMRQAGESLLADLVQTSPGGERVLAGPVETMMMDAPLDISAARQLGSGIARVLAQEFEN